MGAVANKKALYIISFASLALLLFSIFLPNGFGSRIIAAVLLPIASVFAFVFLKKRSTPSINKNQVWLIVSVISVLYVLLYFLSGIHFGFYTPVHPFGLETFLKYVLPISVIIASSELLRSRVIAAEETLSSVVIYFVTVAADAVTAYGVSEISGINAFMDLMGITVLPSVISNFACQYLTKNYGVYPSLTYRLITTLYMYVFPVVSGIPQSLLAIFRLFVPIAMYLFISLLYENGQKQTKKSGSKIPGYIVSILIATGAVLLSMLISNSFRFGAMVVGSESMTGEINKGDAVIFEQYDGEETISEGDVIVFDKGGTKFIHRVVEIKCINNQNRYYTKGDANENRDTGYVTDGDVVGLIRLKIPYVGYATIWLNDIFKNSIGGGVNV